MNSIADARTIDLESLGAIPVVREAAGFYKQNCMVCFNSQGHASGVELLSVYQDGSRHWAICWAGDVTEQLRRARADLNEAVKFAAEAITFLLVTELTEYTAFEQAVRGTTVDFYLAPREQQDDVLIFNRAARLEVSGILEENQGNSVDGRIGGKKRRLVPDEDLPTFISVVEFSRPWSKMVEP